MEIHFENHFAEKVIEISFPQGYQINSSADLQKIKEQWTANLKAWHTPYTCLFDLNGFILEQQFSDDFEGMIRFFKNFFMKKIIGHYEETLNAQVSFECIQGYKNAREKTGLSRVRTEQKEITDFRGLIQIENDFNSHVIEITFRAETAFTTQEHIDILFSKLKNNLMLWHAPYSVLFHCLNCSFTEETKQSFVKIEKFLKAFFCKKIIGYAPRAEKSTYPFPTYRSKHLAAAELVHSGLVSGEVANCSTKKQLL